MKTQSFIIIGIGIALVIGILAVFFASGDPDGLESTALVIQGDKTLTGNTPPGADVNEDIPGRFSYASPLPDYSLGAGWGKPGEAIAIILGIFLAFCAVFGTSKLVAGLRKKPI
jgi:cobalt/nickel transport protein